MNARDYKVLRAGHYYHIYNRGNNKEIIFLDAQDYFNFLIRLKIILRLGQKQSLRIQPLPPQSFTIICYCLMPNHFHFIIRQNSEIGVDRLMAKVCTSYSKYFNKKYGRVGHVFQDTFKAKLVENDSYLKYLTAYIHGNPENPLDYDFSSFKDYVGLRKGEICDKTILMPMFDNDIERYKNFVLSFTAKDVEKISSVLFEE